MRKYLFKLQIVFDFLLATTLAYFGITGYFSFILFNVFLVIWAIFVLYQGLDHIDKLNGYGKYKDDQTFNKKKKTKKT